MQISKRSVNTRYGRWGNVALVGTGQKDSEELFRLRALVEDGVREAAALLHHEK